MVRHRITSFQLLRRRVLTYEKHRDTTSGLILNRSVRGAPLSRYTQETRGIQPKGVTMRRSEDRILTTHTGSLPRPPELTRLYVRRARGEAIDPAELDRVGKAALRRIVDKQIEAGVDIGNNGEQQREAFFLYVRHRMSGFGDSWQRWPRGDVERYPLLKQQMAQMLAAREAVGNYQPPKAIGEVRYVDDTELNAEIADFRTALEAKQNGFVEPFMTAPSPGIIAAAMKNEYYDSEEE